MRTPLAAKKFAKSQLPYWGWGKGQWACLNQLWTNESNWRANAFNKTPVKMFIKGKWVALHAGGIPQRLGLSPKASVPIQINVGLTYIKNRYKSPCGALKWWNNRHFWY